MPAGGDSVFGADGRCCGRRDEDHGEVGAVEQYLRWARFAGKLAGMMTAIRCYAEPGSPIHKIAEGAENEWQEIMNG